MVSLGLNQNTCKNKDLIEFMDFAQDFQGIELIFENIEKYIINNSNIEIRDILEYLETYNLDLINILRLEDFSLCSDSKFNNEILPKLKQMLNFCYKLGCYLITVSPSIESRDIPQWRIIRRTKRKLKEIAKIAYKEDIKVGFEFNNLPNSSISTLSQAKDILKPLVSQENLGYIIDTFYLSVDMTKIEELKEIINQIYLFQLSDVNPYIKYQTSNLKEEFRTFPGNGKFDFEKFFKLIEEYGYRDYYSIELYQNECNQNMYYRFFELNKII
ncbi:MAG: sugar phosphate isomerase/epimerase [Promethearchaeia archaeon]